MFIGTAQADKSNTQSRIRVKQTQGKSVADSSIRGQMGQRRKDNQKIKIQSKQERTIAWQ